MREKGRLVFSNLPQERITPAYAGKSRFEFFNKFIIWDHPRLCGEKKNISLEMIVILGSPPPMRGKGTSGMGRPRQAQDHPRLCGEKDFIEVFGVSLMGSPPPMRGKGIKPLTVSDVQGITPAYAGKRRGKSPVCHRTQDHPRLCGEKPAVSRSFSLSRGSPPPMRGKASPHSCRKSYAGITPAYAGKRHRSCAGDSRCEDHPRLCGEKKRYHQK